MIKANDRVEVNVPEHHTHGQRGYVEPHAWRRPLNPGWVWVRLDGEADPRMYRWPDHLLRVADTVNPTEFATATGALRR